MKRLAIAALAVLALGMGSTPAAAQGGFAQAFGDLYLTLDKTVDPFDPALGPPTICIDDPGVMPFMTLNFFLVLSLDFADIGEPDQNISNGFGGWEAEVTVPAELTVTARTVQPPTSVNVGTGDNWIVGTGITITAANTPYAVVEYSSILLAAAQDLTLTLGPSTPSSFAAAGGPGAAPGWLEALDTGVCDGRCLRPFERYDQCENSFVINYTGTETCAQRCMVATKDTSWGALKSKF